MPAMIIKTTRVATKRGAKIIEKKIDEAKQKLLELAEINQQISDVNASFSQRENKLAEMKRQALGDLPDIDQKLRSDIKAIAMEAECTIKAPNSWKAVFTPAKPSLHYDEKKLLELVDELVGDDPEKIARLKACIVIETKAPIITIRRK